MTKSPLTYILRAVFSWPSLIMMLLMYAVALGAATFIEADQGSVEARVIVYNSLWFYILQFLMVVNLTGRIIAFGFIRKRKWASLIFHAAFIVILIGALVTHIFSREGIVHIREGESSSVMYTDKSGSTEDLPFSATLHDFRIVTYPGSSSPSSYESDITISGEGKTKRQIISMNNILYFGGYRLYQSSYDPDHLGTILTVNRDGAGTVISYIGYFLLIVGMAVAPFQRGSRFRMLTSKLKHFSEMAKMLIIVLLTAISTADVAAQHQRATDHALRREAVSAEHATRFGKIAMQGYDGRIEPINTFAADILRKLSKSSSIAGLNSEQVLIGIFTNPILWSNAPIIDVPNDDIARRLGVTDSRATFNEMFDADGRYIFGEEAEAIFSKETKERNKADKDIVKLDERVNILHALFNGSLINIFPLEGDPSHKWYAAGDDLSRFSGRDSVFVGKILTWYSDEIAKSTASGDWNVPNEILEMITTYQNAKSGDVMPSESRLKAEIFYNKAGVFNLSFKLYLIIGFLMLVALMAGIFGWSGRWSRIAVAVLYAGVLATFLWQSVGIGLRWYISGYAPWSNAYESMVYVGWATALAGIIFSRRSKVVMALAAMLAGVILFVSNLNWMDPEITPLVPVLKSYWLMIHVAVITASYGFFGISALIGTVSLSMMAFGRRASVSVSRNLAELSIINELSIIIGAILLTAGIFFGAVWANESWGRYWGWDPKETWALITMIVYTIVLHSRFVPALRQTYAFSLMSVVSFSTVLMTYFGVNYYLTGMHSYGKTDAFPIEIFIWIGLFVAVLAVAAAIRNRSYKK